MMPASVHVGIVTYNSLADLPRCFDALNQQTYPQVKITVLDNASTDGSAEWVIQHAPHIRCIQLDANMGFGRGHNEIIRKAGLTSDNLYMPLNPDVVLTPRFIEAALAGLQDTGAGWAVGKLLQSGLHGAPTSILYSVGHGIQRNGYTFNIGYGMPDRGQFETRREVFGASGAVALFSGRLIQAIAPDGELFDSDFFMYGEDTDLDWRARLQGWRCWFIPEAVAYHRGSEPSDSLRAQALANRMLSVIKNAYLIDLMLYNMPLIMLHCLLRLIISPRFGWQMTRQIIQTAHRVWCKRRRARVPRHMLLSWFAWSAQQQTGQPRTWLDRLRAMLSSR
jgi:GT2 family glycosyltransferase